MDMHTHTLYTSHPLKMKQIHFIYAEKLITYRQAFTLTDKHVKHKNVLYINKVRLLFYIFIVNIALVTIQSNFV